MNKLYLLILSITLSACGSHTKCLKYGYEVHNKTYSFKPLITMPVYTSVCKQWGK